MLGRRKHARCYRSSPSAGCTLPRRHDSLMDDLLLNCDEMWGRQKIVPPETFDEFFMEAMEHDFNTRIQDGSCWAVSQPLLPPAACAG